MKWQGESEARCYALAVVWSMRPALWKLQAELSSQALVRRCLLCVARLQSSAFGKTKGSMEMRERLQSYAFSAAVRSMRLLAVQRGRAVNYAAA